ncbi:hypothetical protein HOY80DRAFT_900999, partial [Tuber brumale]
MRINDIFLGVAFPAVCATSTYGGSVGAGRCKCSPNDACFPTPTDWQNFNLTLGGQLIKITPLASACFSPSNSSNPEACKHISTLWANTTLHSSDPASIMTPMWAGTGESAKGPCTPTSASCEMGNYPVYSVNVTNPQHVVDTIHFARKRKLRLAIKNTGHDFLGR